MNKEQGKITKAKRKDVLSLTRLFNEEKNLDESPVKYSKKDVYEFVFAKNNQAFAYKIKDEVVGIITGTYWRNSIAMIHQLVVRKKYRKLGIGSKLLECAEKYAKQKGISFIYLYSFLTNKRMHKLIRNFKYKKGEKVLFFYKEFK